MIIKKYFISFQKQGNYTYFLEQFNRYNKLDFTTLKEQDLLDVGDYFGHGNHNRLDVQYSQNMVQKVIDEYKKRETFKQIMTQNDQFQSIKDPNLMNASLIQIILACAKLRYYDKQFLETLSIFYKTYHQKLDIESSKLIPLLYSFKFLQLDDEQFFQILKKNIQDNLNKLNYVNILHLAWIQSCDKYQQQDFPFLEQILQTYETEIKKNRYYKLKQNTSFNYHQIILNIYPQLSKSIYDIKDGQSLQDNEMFDQFNQGKIPFSRFLFDHFLISRKIIKLYHESNQQSQIEVKIYNKNNEQEITQIPNKKQKQNKKKSIFEYNFEQTLNNLDISFEREVLLGIYYVDFLIENTIIELQGPYHYIQDRNRKDIFETVQSQVKRRLLYYIRHLEAMGFQVKQVNYLDWNRLDGSDERKKQFLISLLQ